MDAPRLIAILALSACGGDNDNPNTTPDAAVTPDTAPMIDAPTTVTCAFTEAADATNNSSAGAEATQVAFTGAKTAICGSINNGHFEMGPQRVDVDAYKFSVGVDSSVLVHLIGNAGQLGRVILQLGTTAGMQRGLGVFEGDHGTLSVRLAPGEYVVAVAAFNTADPSAAIPYQVTLTSDAPATRCPKVTAAASFTEANDGAMNNGNDMILFNQSGNPQTTRTPSLTDAPEPTALTIGAGTSVRISGSSAAVDPSDDYEDRDTFQFTTGPTTTQLSVRLNWASTTADFDFKVYPVDTLASVTGGLVTSTTEDEFQTFAV
ncbi:MAG TPA: hypothetical protein VK427_09145, partial [Kofleriaceae bacterium]|nr:hypothetical protein [Kofleriaceae bacterium]